MLTFYKYHGTGNDFVIFDNRDGQLAKDEVEYFAWLCHRRFGVGADGVILLNSHPEFDFEMYYVNSDGRPSSMCGNGGRCIVAFAQYLGIVKDKAHFLAIDGPHEAELTPQGVKLKMGLPKGFQTLGSNNFWIDTGSPHYVRIAKTPVADLDVQTEGASIRNSAAYQAEGTNVNFARVVASDHLEVRTYERGVEAETWSCGTGVTAVAEVYARRAGLSYATVKLSTPGGELTVHTNGEQAPWLEGPAVQVFQGTIKGPQSNG